MQADDDHTGQEEDAHMDFDRAALHDAIEGAVSGHPEIAAAYLYGSAARGTATPLLLINVIEDVLAVANHVIASDTGVRAITRTAFASSRSMAFCLARRQRSRERGRDR